MPEQKVLNTKDLPADAKKTIKIRNAQGQDTEILLLNHEGSILALEAKCPHAGAPLDKGSMCNGRLVCPWHMATFALPSGALVEPPALRPLKMYPVRISGEDIYVDPEEAKTAGSQQPDENAADTRTFLLVGSGAAGVMAATTLRLEGFAGRIVAVDPVSDEPIDRTQLSKMVLAGKMPLDKVKIDAFEKNSVGRIVAKVVDFSASRKQAKLSDGQTLSFDAALIATGAAPKRLDIPGAEFAHTLRHTEDVKKILAASEHAKNAAIIGTSFIGLEAASALVQKGLHVTVIGPETLPFAKKFGDQVAEALKSLHESKGVDFRLGVEVLQITAQGVQFRKKQGPVDAHLLAADVVILGVGVEPELDFAHDLPLAKKGGIQVGSDLRVAEGVWVAGDIANVEGTRIEHWRLAEQHGQFAAKQMLGTKGHYDGVPFFWTFHHGKRLGYLGHVEEWDEIRYDGSVEALTFLAFYLKAGKVAAILSCGRDTDTAMLAEVMRRKPTLEEARKAIRK